MVQSRYHASFFPREAPALNEPTITQTVLFADLVDRPLTATFDQLWLVHGHWVRERLLRYPGRPLIRAIVPGAVLG